MATSDGERGKHRSGPLTISCFMIDAMAAVYCLNSNLEILLQSRRTVRKAGTRLLQLFINTLPRDFT